MGSFQGLAFLLGSGITKYFGLPASYTHTPPPVPVLCEGGSFWLRECKFILHFSVTHSPYLHVPISRTNIRR
jgi:hypothetical protein